MNLLELGPLVAGDLEDIADFIATDNPQRAASFIQEIRNRLRLIAQSPLIFRLRPEIGQDARLAVHGRYVILFRIDGDVVRVERVVFGGRELAELLRESS